MKENESSGCVNCAYLNCFTFCKFETLF